MMRGCGVNMNGSSEGTGIPPATQLGNDGTLYGPAVAAHLSAYDLAPSSIPGCVLLFIRDRSLTMCCKSFHGITSKCIACRVWVSKWARQNMCKQIPCIACVS